MAARPTDAEPQARAEDPTGADRPLGENEPGGDRGDRVGVEGRAGPGGVRQHIRDDKEGGRALRDNTDTGFQEAARPVPRGDAAAPEPAHQALGELPARGQVRRVSRLLLLLLRVFFHSVKGSRSKLRQRHFPFFFSCRNALQKKKTGTVLRRIEGISLLKIGFCYGYVLIFIFFFWLRIVFPNFFTGV